MNLIVDDAVGQRLTINATVELDLHLGELSILMRGVKYSHPTHNISNRGRKRRIEW